MVALSQRRTAKYGLLFITLSAFCWGMGTVMSKYALDYIPPLTLLAVQLATSSAFLWLLTFLRKTPFTWNREAVRHGWTGILEPGLAYMIGLAGLLRTTASSASFIGATEPLLVIFLAWIFLRERLTKPVFGLVLLALFGTLLISGGQAEGSTSQSALGDGLVFIGTACAALYVVISRSSVEHIHPLPLAALQQSFGLLMALIVLPFALAGGEGLVLAAVPLRTWMWAVITGVIQYGCAFWFYLSAIQEIPATQAASFLMLIPVFGVAGASLFLGEQLTFIQFIGGILILAALAGVYRARQPLS